MNDAVGAVGGLHHHTVQPHPPGKRPPREAQLAWAIACLAADDAPLDDDAAEMASCRLVDDWACALPALNRPPVRSARDQARCFARKRGASVLGLGPGATVDCGWAAWANATAVRELDFHDSFFGLDPSHPGDVIPSVLAAAEQLGASGETLIRGIVTAYEVQTALARGIALNPYRIDHVAHLGPAVAAGVAALLRLPPEIGFEAINHAAHVSLSTRQARKGRISSWKAFAPGHVGKAAIEAVDRAMRGETSPAPIWEGDYGILAVLLGGPEIAVDVPLPPPGAPCRAILDTYPKAHSAGYHGQAVIDLALRMRPGLGDPRTIRSVELRSKRMTHVVMGAGSGDPDKWDPGASRETLDHSAMFIFARALWDGWWHHERSYDPTAIAAPDFVSLWRRVTTVEDADWNERFDRRDGLEKDHGLRAVVTFEDGRIVEDEIAVADSHPRGAAPWTRSDYERKFETLTADLVPAGERARFLEAAARLRLIPAGRLDTLAVTVPESAIERGAPGLFDRTAGV
ncbi:MAG: MmgE/PrpD family protein [Pseudomonadota bacterium]